MLRDTVCASPMPSLDLLPLLLILPPLLLLMPLLLLLDQGHDAPKVPHHNLRPCSAQHDLRLPSGQGDDRDARSHGGLCQTQQDRTYKLRGSSNITSRHGSLRVTQTCTGLAVHTHSKNCLHVHSYAHGDGHGGLPCGAACKVPKLDI